ncbi:hypothetical protein AAG570_011456 [Ranatra chinensis]|uniref:Uncharacterized protein n=1 Tax=Ranatra chinensis TaxID=642074 RepID=A0ABD0YKY0_9HEMI
MVDKGSKPLCVYKTCRPSDMTFAEAITSVLVLTQLSTELAEEQMSGGVGNGNSGGNKINSNSSNNSTIDGGGRGSITILLGMDMAQFMELVVTSTSLKYTPHLETVIMIGFLFVSFIYALSSAFLIWGTIVEQSWCSVGWLVSEAISISCQVSSMALPPLSTQAAKHKWTLMFISVHFLLSVYFWIVVFSAQRVWSKRKKRRKNGENETVSTASSSPTEAIQDELFFQNAQQQDLQQQQQQALQHAVAVAVVEKHLQGGPDDAVVRISDYHAMGPGFDSLRGQSWLKARLTSRPLGV